MLSQLVCLMHYNQVPVLRILISNLAKLLLQPEGDYIRVACAKIIGISANIQQSTFLSSKTPVHKLQTCFNNFFLLK